MSLESDEVPGDDSGASLEVSGNKGVVAMGQRRAYVAQVRALVDTQGAKVREGLADEQVVKEYVAAIRRGISVGSRTEMNLYAQIMKLVGEERRITVEFINSLGAKDEQELRRLVDIAKSGEGASIHDSAERCVAFLEAYFNAYPDQRLASVRRLGGYVPV